MAVFPSFHFSGAPSPSAFPGSFPDATNTGHVNAPGYTGAMTTWNFGVDEVQSDTTYSFYDSDSGFAVGSVGSPVSNVTFYGCRMNASGALNCPVYGDNITFDYCTFVPNTAPPVSYANGYQYGISANGSFNTFVQQLTVTHCDMYGFGNAIDAGGSTQAKPHRFEHNWIHDARDDGGIDHTDGIGEESGGGSTMSYVVINHNTIESHGNTQGIAYQNGVYDHFTITNNLIGGWNTAVQIGDFSGRRPSNITFTDNVFSTRLNMGFRPLYNAFWTSTGSIWTRNRWYVPAGAAWGTPGNSGKFWIPNTTDYVNTDNIYVSDTDYSP